jgi:hypothetical protein
MLSNFSISRRIVRLVCTKVIHWHTALPLRLHTSTWNNCRGRESRSGDDGRSENGITAEHCRRIWQRPRSYESWERGRKCTKIVLGPNCKIHLGRNNILKNILKINEITSFKKKGFPHPGQGCSFTYYTQYWWGTYHFKNTCSSITLANISSISLVFIFRCSSSPNNPVYERRVDFSDLVFSLSSHRHSYIGFVFGSRFLDS